MSALTTRASIFSPFCLARITAASLIAVGSASAQQQPVRLQIRPQAGDTLRMKLDQRVELEGTTRLANGETTTTRTTALIVMSRVIVESTDREGSTIVATTDSIAIEGNTVGLPVSPEALRRLQGSRVRLRVSPDGNASLVDDAGAVHPDVRAFLAHMPASLPTDQVTVGSKWSREMAVPVAGDPAAPTVGTMRATFRLDSLSAGGSTAYLSVAGTLDRAAVRRSDLRGGSMDMAGEMNGRLVIDRIRGWITDARVIFFVRSLLSPPPGSTASPIHLRMRITQWMRVR
jgi:hypothetical protein